MISLKNDTYQTALQGKSYRFEDEFGCVVQEGVLIAYSYDFVNDHLSIKALDVTPKEGSFSAKTVWIDGVRKFELSDQVLFNGESYKDGVTYSILECYYVEPL